MATAFQLHQLKVGGPIAEGSIRQVPKVARSATADIYTGAARGRVGQQLQYFGNPPPDAFGKRPALAAASGKLQYPFAAAILISPGSD
jgi:hypothetical protein